ICFGSFAQHGRLRSGHYTLRACGHRARPRTVGAPVAGMWPPDSRICGGDSVTELAGAAGAHQVERIAGHSRVDISLHYTQADQDVQTKAESWWARGDSNARPLPCQGKEAPLYPIDESASD